ncbi:hypothetical protein EYZ11_001049 [Aspergillus tanneri]|uniref:Uncharacterized protein n=1 Tax=Aspergillus tanneri TaxID=1220188 RepID=A0A4V3UQL6_9EURO|nr:hypothetical protein EYZ11_001049 [Aspergillus tanneri]
MSSRHNADLAAVTVEGSPSVVRLFYQSADDNPICEARSTDPGLICTWITALYDPSGMDLAPGIDMGCEPRVRASSFVPTLINSWEQTKKNGNVATIRY